MPLRTLNLSSATLRSPDERLEGWHEVQAPLFEVDMAAGRQAVLDWRFQLHHLGVSICGQTRSNDQRIQRTASAIATGNCDHVFIDYLVDCDLAGEAAGKTFQAKSGDIVLFDMARPMAFDIAAPNPSQGGWRSAFVMIPRAHFQASCDMRNLHGWC
jgi:hypothetical protein